MSHNSVCSYQRDPSSMLATLMLQKNAALQGTAAQEANFLS